MSDYTGLNKNKNKQKLKGALARPRGNKKHFKMSATLLNRLAELEKEIKAIKKEISKESTKEPVKEKSKKPKSIDDCKTKEEINKFKVAEIKAWITENDIDVKDLDEKYKEDLIKIVWKNLNVSEGEDEDTEDAGDGYEWYYY